MTTRGKRAVLALTLPLLAVFLAGGIGLSQGIDQGFFLSDNVKFIENVPTPQAGISGKVVGHYFYLSSYQDVEIFDISTPTNPVKVGSVPVNVERENEEMPTNGKILGVSSSMGCQYWDPTHDTPYPTDNRWEGTPVSCLELFDVRDPTKPTLLTHVVGAGQHTSTCLYDCSYMWGQYGGEVTDLRHVFDSGHPAPIIGNWMDHLPTIPISCPGSNGDISGAHKCDLSKVQCHNVVETAPGFVFAACYPILLLSVRPEDGADVVHPKVISYGINPDGVFVHSTQWPQQGADKFALVGEETNGVPRCDRQQNASLSTWIKGPDDILHLVHEFHLQDGTWTDGNPPVHTLGCSVHWFQPHPTFHDGGLISQAAYDNGNRFLQITADGNIVDRGFFTRVNAATWSSYWMPDQKTVYVIDDYVGFDVIQWNGPLYQVSGAGITSQAPAAPAPAQAVAGANQSLPSTSAPRSWSGVALMLLLTALGLSLAGFRRRPA